LKDAAGVRDVPIAGAIPEIGAAVRDAALVLIPSPATAQDDIAGQLAPHLRDGQVVFLPPGTFGSYAMAQAVRAAGNRARVAWAETGTLPYLARKHGAREINVTARAVRLPTGVYPARDADRAIELIPARLPERAPVRRCPLGRADERRADHPPAADRDERGAAAAPRTLGHPCRRHAAGGARGDRSARPGAHRGARGVRLGRAALPAGRPLHERPLDVRRCPQATRQVGRLA
jgi:hypothetical protein